jgi:hypothetical protein
VRDGEVDTITCGNGNRDRVFADQYDVISDATPADPTGSCEVVNRMDASTETARDEDRTESPKDDSREH